MCSHYIGYIECILFILDIECVLLVKNEFVSARAHSMQFSKRI